MNENEWKWMKMNENEWKWMKMNENEWKWMKMNENEWTYMIHLAASTSGSQQLSNNVCIWFNEFDF